MQCTVDLITENKIILRFRSFYCNGNSEVRCCNRKKKIRCTPHPCCMSKKILFLHERERQRYLDEVYILGIKGQKKCVCVHSPRFSTRSEVGFDEVIY